MKIPEKQNIPISRSRIIVCFKDCFISFILFAITILFAIQPQMKLSPDEEIKRVSLTTLYNRSLIDGSLNEEKKRKFLTIWKSIMQPKNNKFKVLKIYLCTSVSFQIFLIITFCTTEFIYLLLMYNQISFRLFSGRFIVLQSLIHIAELGMSLQFVNLIRMIQEILLIRMCFNILKMFKAYKLFFKNTKKEKFIKFLCYFLLLNMFFSVNYISSVCPHMFWGITYIGVSIITMFIKVNLLNKPFVRKLNHSFYKIIG